MANELLADVLTWSSERPAWQRDALRRLFTAGTLTPADVDELLDLCKASRGLSSPRTPDVLARAHLPITDGGPGPVSLIDVTHHRGVNALAPEQTVTFGPQLTIVYGQNAAGKSGYTRILKRACRSRFSEEILGNVLADSAPLKGQATIRFRLGEEPQAVPWNPDAAPPPALAAVSVFDAQCAPVYLRDKTDVAFRPFGLDVFDRLASACVDLRKRLEGELAVLQASAPVLPTVAEGTRVAALLSALTSLTKPEDVRALATFTDQEQSRLKQLRDQQRDVQAADPKKRAQELELKASRVALIAGHAASVFAVLGEPGLEKLRTSAKALDTSKAVLARLRETVLTSDLLPGTGEGTWRQMWDAAYAFSAVAYPERDFPVLAPGAKCPLCQQPIGPDAQSRFQHFLELVSSTAQADVREAEREHAVNVPVTRDDITLALRELEADDAALAQGVRTFLEAAERVKAGLSGEQLPASGVQTNPEADLRAAATALCDRSAQLRQQTPAMLPQDATVLKELEARAALQGQLQFALNAIERKKREAAYTQCLEDVSTQAITRKSTELTKRLVTECLREAFQAELRKLEFTHLAVEIKAAGGAKGALFHQLVFRNAPSVAVVKVLSEGESRTLSLAAFLAELSTAPARSAIIFDDPVSSLDHIWRERIARRLVLEAKTRQVIVFTHDLVFLKLLLEECGRQDVAYHHQYVRRGEASGLCSAELPWVAMRVKERLGVLRNKWQAAEKLFRTAGPETYEREARDIYGLLREAWEQAVPEVLLNEVVERYRPSIETKRARPLHDIVPEDYTALELGMTECSRWIRGHDQPPADGTPFPGPADLAKQIQDLDDWVQRILKRRKSKKTA